MSAKNGLNLAQVMAWKPEVLFSASAGLDTAQSAIEAQTNALKSTIGDLRDNWSGSAADSAIERTAREISTGWDLVDALAVARKVLTNGGTDIGRARTLLLSTASEAASQGFLVGEDGTVSAPTLPPVMSNPEDSASAAAARNTAQRRLNDQAQVVADDISRELEAVADADARTADALAAIDIPANLEAEVEAYLERLQTNGDWLESLGQQGAGGAALAQALNKGVAAGGAALAQALNKGVGPITHYDAFLANITNADKAFKTFKNGAENGGLMRFLVGSKTAKIAGKVFLPLTVLTGGLDVANGGGYDGARGVATRGFGLAGASGAATLLVAGSALGPVGLAVAGGAVLAYGAWSAGNMIWDNHEEIGNAWNATSDFASDPADRLENAGKGALHTASFGLLG